MYSLSNDDVVIVNVVIVLLQEKDKHVEALDDGQLRALLDEAITYKCPKDREGKSNLFKVRDGPSMGRTTTLRAQRY